MTGLPVLPVLAAVEGTDLFVASPHGPRQVVRVTVRTPGPGRWPVRLRVEGPTVTTSDPVSVIIPEASGSEASGSEETVVEVPVAVAEPSAEGSLHRVTAVLEVLDAPGAGATTLDGTIRAAATGWTMWMVSHFHYDPVWWNTQAGFTQAWYDLPVAEGRRPPICRTAFDLVRAHLDAALADPDYRFVLAEVDYLEPFWVTRPQDRAVLRRLLAEGRLEIVGGMYNEPNTNLTHPESTIRNLEYGLAFQRDVLGGDPRTAWQLDVFGHDPAFPGLLAQAGLDSSAWARGPFHMVGPKRHVGDITRMQFPSEFEWLSPSGHGVLTHYMADHYVAGWQVEVRPTLEDALAEAYREFGDLKKVAATRNVMLPVGHDHNVPSRWVTQIHRAWPERYVWPRFVTGLPRDFFAAVRAEAGDRPGALRPQTRDMGPVFTGKDVSYIDTKQGQRAGEVAVLDAERLGTLASLTGARYPVEALDKAWRQLLYGAHHDAITGTESDQVYLDLLAGWREAHDLGVEARDAALDHLAAVADTTGPGEAVLVANTLSWNRSGLVTVTVPAGGGAHGGGGADGVALVDEQGGAVPAVTLARGAGTVTLTARVPEVPALGHRVLRAVPAAAVPAGWQPGEQGSGVPPRIANDAFLVEADPLRGGAISRVLDRRTGRDLLRPGGLGAEVYLQDEHPMHPVWEEGPWHLLPRGPGRGSGTVRADVRVETCPIGSRLVSTFALDDLRLTQEVTLWDGARHVDVALHVDGSIGRDRLLRSRFGFDLPGALPVAEVGFAVVGRSPGFADVDTAEHQWTLDSPAHTWAGLSAPVTLRLRDADGSVQCHAVGVVEVVAPATAARTVAAVRRLLVRLAALGVTATWSLPDGARYGSLDVDSNLPDLRIVVGSSTGPAADRRFRAADRPRHLTWRPGADLRPPGCLPELLLDGTDLDAVIDGVVADLADGRLEVDLPAGAAGTTDAFCGHSVALVNAGTPSFVVDAEGTLHVSLMRSCSGWPSGVWIDGEPRTVPDGSPFGHQHWSHTFRLRLLSGAGDWRDAGFVTAAQEHTHPLLARPVPSSPGPVPPAHSYLRVEPPAAVLSSLTPDPAHPGRVRARVYESTGSPLAATVTVNGIPGTSGVTGAPRVPGVTRAVDLGAAQVHAFAVDVPAAPVAGPDGARLGPTDEAVQPVHSRYWMRNLGPAPLGGLPVTVHVEPSLLRPEAAGGVEATVTVAAHGVAARGAVEVLAPDGLLASVSPVPEFALQPGEYREFAVGIRPSGPHGPAPGRYPVLVRVRDGDRIVEDSTVVEVGPPDDGPLLEVDVVPAGPPPGPGEATALRVLLRSRAAGPLHGEVLALSPFGTWGGPDAQVVVTPRTQGFTVEAGGSAEVALRVAVPPTARPGAHLWCGVKVAALDRAYYSPTVRLEVVDG